MELGYRILSRRRALGLTQEQVAQRLGVTPQAVYKWEKDIACPDVALLSPLARLLQTDVNALLAFHDSPSQEQIAEVVNAVSDCAMEEGGVEAAFAKARDALREYPSSAQLHLSLAAVLEGVLNLCGADEPERRRELDDMYRFAIASGDERICATAQSILVMRLIKSGALNEAETMIDAMPEAPPVKWPYQVQLLRARGQLDDAAALQEKHILVDASALGNALIVLIDMAMEREDFAWAETLCGALEALVDAFSLWKGSPLGARLEIAACRRDAGEALAAMEALYAALREPFIPNAALYPHADFKRDTGPWMREKLPELLRRSLREEPHYAFLREDAQCAQRLSQLLNQDA